MFLLRPFWAVSHTFFDGLFEGSGETFPGNLFWPTGVRILSNSRWIMTHSVCYSVKRCFSSVQNDRIFTKCI